MTYLRSIFFFKVQYKHTEDKGNIMTARDPRERKLIQGEESETKLTDFCH